MVTKFSECSVELGARCEVHQMENGGGWDFSAAWGTFSAWLKVLVLGLFIF